MDANKRKKYELELRRLDHEYADLEQHWQRVPRFAWSALSVPVSLLAYRFAAAVVALLVSVALVATRRYLIGVRKSENRWLRASVAREIEGEQEDQPTLRARHA